MALSLVAGRFVFAHEPEVHLSLAVRTSLPSDGFRVELGLANRIIITSG